MGLKLKVCHDCGVRKMIGRSKSRCKACRVADPTKFENRPPRRYAPAHKRKKPQPPPLVGSLSPKTRSVLLKICGYASYAAYLQSELWFSIRAKILPAACACGCGRVADQVHHTQYTEANLMGMCLDYLVPLNHHCHHAIEFRGKQKSSLSEANAELQRRQRRHHG